MTPEGWTSRRFADVADYKAGRTPTRALREYWEDADDGVPWVSISDMTEFGIVSRPKERITKLAFDQVFRGISVPAGTLLMSYKLTIGRIATLGIDACHNEAIIAIFPCESIDQRYLGYFLAQVDYGALQDRQVKGNTLNREKINRINILIPPSQEQSAISEILDSVRYSINVQDRALSTILELKRAVINTLFAHGVRGEAQKETEIGPMPESWELQPLGALCVDTDSVDLRSEGHRIIEYVDVSSISREYLRINTTSRHVLKEAPGRARKRIQAGDVIFATVRPTLLRLAVVPKELNGQVCSTAFCVLRHERENVAAKFIYYIVQRDRFVQQLGEIETGASYPAVTDRMVKEQLVPLPSQAEQRDIVAILDAIDRKIDLHRRKRAVLKDLFKTLLHKLMTGEIQVGNLAMSAGMP